MEEKRSLVNNLKDRILKIERVIGDIKFYEKPNNENKTENDDIFYDCSENQVHNNNKSKEHEQSTENQKYLDEIKSCLENVSLENLINTNKDELIEMIKKHEHKNSIAVHICIIKLILQQISKEYLQDLYSQYNDFYIYIHSNSILDVYNTFEYKKNIILSHLNFMRTYSAQIKNIMELKEHINSYKISETEIHLDRLNKIEDKNDMLFEKVSAINSSLESLAYKYAIMFLSLKQKTETLLSCIRR
ncbi:conserved Plasmodium protein, unknown function [Plasmodium malariae]|uniref:Uncharacterized protein n=2 Tax=Plasmodium malariae TaxID=5858 RepID=A0A1D3TFC4_PLAMA|nr:conserved Plasmodium protein, unknown function [Plasmodium malariae]SCP03666.1 conserved Plasmodium protein, unknown function [Plasmodium malariae]